MTNKPQTKEEIKAELKISDRTFWRRVKAKKIVIATADPTYIVLSN